MNHNSNPSQLNILRFFTLRQFSPDSIKNNKSLLIKWMFRHCYWEPKKYLNLKSTLRKNRLHIVKLNMAFTNIFIYVWYIELYYKLFCIRIFGYLQMSLSSIQALPISLKSSIIFHYCRMLRLTIAKNLQPFLAKNRFRLDLLLE